MDVRIALAMTTLSLLNPGSLPTPAGATNVVTSEEGVVAVITFDLSATFPAAPAIDHYAAHFANRGWTRCRSYPAAWEGISWPTPDGLKLREVKVTAWRSPDAKLFAVLAIDVEHSHDAPPPDGLPVREKNRLATMRVAQTVGTDTFVFASRCEEGPIWGPFTDSDRYPHGEVPRR